MSIATVVTRGYGSFGTIPLVVTAGYSVGAIVADDRISTRAVLRSAGTTAKMAAPLSTSAVLNQPATRGKLKT